MEMTTNEVRKHAEFTIELYLQRIQSITQDYAETLELLDRQPKEILLMRDDELKDYLSVIYVCRNSVMLEKMQVKYKNNRFKVKLFINK